MYPLLILVGEFKIKWLYRICHQSSPVSKGLMPQDVEYMYYNEDENSLTTLHFFVSLRKWWHMPEKYRRNCQPRETHSSQHKQTT